MNLRKYFCRRAFPCFVSDDQNSFRYRVLFTVPPDFRNKTQKNLPTGRCFSLNFFRQRTSVKKNVLLCSEFRCLSGVCRSCDNRADKTLKAWPGDGCPLKAKCQCAFGIRILNLVQGTNNLTVFNPISYTLPPPHHVFAHNWANTRHTCQSVEKT